MMASNNRESRDRLLTSELAADRAIAEFGDEAAGYAAMCADYCFNCGYTSVAIIWARAMDLIDLFPFKNSDPVH
jgi:hypothetical protein